VAQLEAVLFLAREPLGTRKLAQLTGLADGTEARTLVRKLNRLYDAEGCAFRIEEVAGGVQLMSRPKFAPWLRRLHSVPVEVRLSAPMMETLAVVAYRQPVLRAEIEAVRGVQCGEILRQLMERDLVRIVGRSEELGRPFQYGTSRQFLRVFGLRRLEELPQPEGFFAAATVATAASDSGSGGPTTDNEVLSPSIDDLQPEEAKVKVSATKRSVSARAQQTTIGLGSAPVEDEARVGSVVAAKDDDDLDEDDDDLDDDDDDDDDLDDDEDEDDDLDEDEDDFEDEWEEVDDEDDDLDEDEDEDDDWDDDDDDDWEDDDDDEDEDEDDDEKE
jgi:segregation and condensation protein B